MATAVEEVVEPASEEEAASLLAAAHAAGRAVLIRGGGTKLAWGRPPARRDVVVSTARLAGVVSHDAGDLVCTVRAGTPLAELRRVVSSDPAHRQALMLDPRHGDAATVGGVLAANASGPARTRYGTPRDLVLGVRYVLADGTIGKAGGRVVKNVAGFDLGKLLIGSLGTLALLTEVVLKLHPAPPATGYLTVEGHARTLGDAARRLATLPVVPTWAEAILPAGALVIRLDSTAEGVAAQAEAIRASVGARDVEAATAEALLAAGHQAVAGAAASVRVSVPPARLGVALAELERRGLATVARALLGSGEAALRDDDPSRVAELRRALEAVGGQVVVLASTARLADVVWPAIDPVAADLAAAVKHRLDPAGVLAPGRVVAA